MKKIGKVIATEKNPSTIDEFYFWTKTDLILNPFDIVKIDHIKNSKSFAVIEEISHITDAANFLANYISSDFGDIESDGNTYRVGMNYVKARVIGNTENIYIPLQNDSIVYLASKEEIALSLGLSDVESPIICGYIDMYEGIDGVDSIRIPVEMDSRFLIGPEGAHLNISGISGLASKTSYAMFLLKALQDRALIDDNDGDTAFVLFNVKGKDLLAIDEKNEFKNIEEQKETEQLYNEMGLKFSPFRQVKYFYPFSNNSKWNTYADSEYIQRQISMKKGFFYKYDYKLGLEHIDLLFSSIDDPTQSIDAIINFINTNNDFNKINSWSGFIDNISQYVKTGNNKEKDITVQSWRKFSRIVNKAIKGNVIFDGPSESMGEIELYDAFKNITNNDVFVIDIAKLDENMQSFIFGSVIRYIYELKLESEESKEMPSKIIIFIDELNKYASTDIPKSSPILRQILDIAERGRSLGVILFGAEQFKSSIHTRVVGNCSAHAYGRTNAIEVSKSEYKFIPNVYKSMMTRLKQGEYIIHNPAFRSLLNIKFPKPVYKQFK